ncbi:subtilisin-like protease SBT1.7 [Colletotrichum spaethianum]|uniref:Subtilisin-like protease SBT1.7 n=1 Tax=Colletotrichum spaethianum TaxID=700344 RepID=A0AA37LD13_9PEZI|nr:subtilisin-like protease SBT1.7 [Colletotrichum spaethianum]GKT44294.1 subtilisin-like protease SBT1.7 [Colletotrichum spaethianum]
MHSGGLLWWLAVLLLSSGVLSLPRQDEWHDLIHRRHQILARQHPLSNTTRPASTATSTQPLITPDPRSSTRISSALTTIGTSSSAPVTSTISGDKDTPVVAVIGVTYVAGAGGASLLVGSTVHTLAPGAVVAIVAPSQNPRTTDPASESRPATSASSGPSSTSASPTSSVSSTATPTPYIILTSQNATREQIQNLNSTLSKDATPNSLEEVTSDRTGLVVFFKANITSGQADVITKLDGVGGVTPDEKLEEEEQPASSAPPSSTSHQATATGPHGSPKTTVPNPTDIGLQTGAVDELKAISQPPGSSLADLPGFGYASEAGKGVTIYVIDTGANAQNTEWTGMPGTKGFMYAPGATKDESDFLNHGSCVASKSAGPMYGTAKDANMIMAKLPGDLSLSAIFTVLVEISNDVYQKGIDGKAVINMSLGSRIPEKLSSTTTAYKLLLVALMAEDIVIVTASGNDAQYGIDDVTEYPALFGPTTDIIVVGAVENDGYRAFFSQGTGDQLTVSAPGFVDCASGRASGSQELYGTSFVQQPAAPAVAGVIAVWLSQDEYKDRLQVPGKVAANVKAMVQSLAYSRVEGEPAVIWNGIDPRGLACTASGSSSNRRRQAAASGCQATSVAPSSTSAPPASTSAPAATSAAPSASASAQPSAPPKPQWDENPQGFQKVFEEDGVASFDYVATSDSASEGVTDNIEQWCLAKCTDKDYEAKANIYFKQRPMRLRLSLQATSTH